MGLLKEQGTVSVSNFGNNNKLATSYNFLDPLEQYFAHVGQSSIGGGSVKITKVQVETGSGYACGISTWNTAGRMLDIRRIRIKSDRKISFALTKGFNSGNFPTNIENHLVTPGVEIILNVNYLLRSGYLVTLFAKTWFDSDTTDATINVVFEGTIKTDDVLMNTNFDICWIGDSILSGQGPDYTYQMYNFLFRDYLRKNSINCRNEIRSAPGSQTAAHVPLAIYNNYNLPRAKFFGIGLGSNDAINAISKATYKSNIQQIINSLLYSGDTKTACVLIVGPPPLYSTTYEALAVQHRAAGIELMNEDTTGRVFAVDLTGAFDNTVLTNYKDSDGVHFLASGHTGVYNKIATFMSTVKGLQLMDKLKKMNT